MNDNQKLRRSAVDWLNGNREFDRGVDILTQAGFKPGVVAKLRRVGYEGPAAKERLLYLIREFISVFGGTPPEDTDAELHVFKGKESPIDQPETSSKAIMAMAERVEAQDPSIPENIAVVIREYAAAYKVREQAFTALQSMSEDNDEKTMLHRKNLSEAIDEATSTMERLYPFYDNYLNEHRVPTEQELQAVKLADEPLEPSQPEASPSDLTLTDRDINSLKAEKKALKTKILRARNMLDYQQETKADKPNPLPACPKRTKYETKIKNLNKRLEDIEYILAQNA